MGSARGLLSASSRGRPIADDLVERLGSLAHLTELALANAMTHRRFQRQATVDPLTDLTNRRGFDQALRRISGRTPFAILVIDVDGLKIVNDHWGHSQGDRLIIGVGAALAGVIRRGDTLARVGGDEFAALVLDASQEAIAHLEARMQAAVAVAAGIREWPASASVPRSWGRGMKSRSRCTSAPTRPCTGSSEGRMPSSEGMPARDLLSRSASQFRPPWILAIPDGTRRAGERSLVRTESADSTTRRWWCSPSADGMNSTDRDTAPGNWSTQQLAEFLVAVAASTDARSASFVRCNGHPRCSRPRSRPWSPQTQ